MDKVETFTMWQVDKHSGAIKPITVLSETALMVVVPTARWGKQSTEYQRKETQYAKLFSTWPPAYTYAVTLLQKRKARLRADLAAVDGVLCQLELATPDKAFVVGRGQP